MTRRIRPSAGARAARGLSLETEHGVVSFSLAACANGVYVERIHVRPGVDRLVQEMLFESDDSFLRWCDADRLQLDHPLAFANLRRRGCALFPALR